MRDVEATAPGQVPRDQHRRRQQREGDGLHWAQPAAEGEAGWDAEWERRLFAWACEQVRPGVTDVTWQAFWRTAVDGQPGKQVAAELGLTVAAVYNARSRVTARLKELVQAEQEP